MSVSSTPTDDTTDTVNTRDRAWTTALSLAVTTDGFKRRDVDAAFDTLDGEKEHTTRRVLRVMELYGWVARESTLSATWYRGDWATGPTTERWHAASERPTARDRAWDAILTHLHGNGDGFKMSDLTVFEPATDSPRTSGRYRSIEDGERHTTRRVLRAMEELGWVTRESPTHRYWHPGPRATRCL